MYSDIYDVQCTTYNDGRPSDNLQKHKDELNLLLFYIFSVYAQHKYLYF